MITYVKGDATEPVGDGFKYLCHIVNDVGAFGAGFALALSKKYPTAKSDYLKNPMKLGDVRLFHCEQDGNADITIVHMCAQKGLRSRYNPRPVQYDHLEYCLKKVKYLCFEHVKDYTNIKQSSIHLPKIGAGLGGGKWSTISKIIEEVFHDKEVFVYEL